jgi:spore germination protein (amino acid permease)
VGLLTNSITNRQMFFILILTLTSYTSIDFPKIMAETAGRSGWILILAASLIFGLAAVVITSLNNRFQGKVLFDYSQEIAGKLISRVIVVYYLVYFFVVGVYLNIRLVNFLSANFLPKTSQGVMLGVCVVLFALVAFRGVTNVARLFELYGLAFLLTTVALCAIMLPQGMVYNVLPLVNADEIKNFAEAIPKLPFPFGGIEVLLIIPFSKNNKKAPLVGFLTLVFIGFFYVLIVESTMSILGINNTILYSGAFIEAIKVVNIPILERTDIFYLTVGLTGLFSGLIMVFMAALEYACRLFQKVQRPVMSLVVGGVYFTLCLFALGMKDLPEMLDLFSPYTVTVSSILIPTALFAVSKIKDKRGGAA